MKPGGPGTGAWRSRRFRAPRWTAPAMADKPTSPWLQLQAWREQGADRIDPLRFSLIDGLARRAAAHDGQVTQLL
ncbi:DUF2894 domain-containing protein, partial [Stenotrophomonas pictorum]|uniref:DUF2894 domain-containing protein n=1 Tax=Stenotrophomonas pictorum TaxID=86184 RepID=UPI0031B5BECE